MFDEGSHGPDCVTHTIPIQCRGCRQRVFLFSCNHGSSVVFDKLGLPWPEHECSNRRERDRQRAARVRRRRTETRPDLAPQVGPSPGAGDRRGRRPTETISPSAWLEVYRHSATPHADEVFVGTVHELERVADPVAHFGVADLPLGRAGLRRLVKQPVGRLTVHVPDEEDIDSFTAWGPCRLFADDALVHGATVEARLVALEILTPEPRWVWYCRSLEVLLP